MAISDLYKNRPDGVFRLTGVHYLERGTLNLTWRALLDGQPVDLSGCTVDYASMDAAIDGSPLMNLGVALGADGVIEINGDLAQSTESLALHEINPHGRDVVVTVRCKDPSTFPFYLVAPSTITINHAPGEST